MSAPTTTRLERGAEQLQVCRLTAHGALDAPSLSAVVDRHGLMGTQATRTTTRDPS